MFPCGGAGFPWSLVTTDTDVPLWLAACPAPRGEGLLLPWPRLSVPPPVPPPTVPSTPPVHTEFTRVPALLFLQVSPVASDNISVVTVALVWEE